MNLPPYSHHEILAIVEPFARQGWQVDLAASDRIARRLVMRRHEAHAGLTLENPAASRWQLTRTCTLPGGLQARLVAEGDAPGALLERIDAIDAARQGCSGPGYEIAWQQRVERARPGTSTPTLVLTQAIARVDGLTLRLRVPQVRQLAAELDIDAGATDTIELPQDLLAVLGWHWARLRPVRGGWTSKLRIGRHEPARSRHAEARFERSVAHVAATLAQPPAQFHARWRAARWGVVARRGIPLATFIALVAAAFALPRAMAAAPDMRLWVMVFHVPLLLLAASLSLQELSQVEVPPLPRPLRRPAWRKPPASASKDSTHHDTTPARNIATSR